MGKRKQTSDFNVDTNSRCFICFEKVSNGFSSVHSLQYLSQYVTLDMKKVFNDEELIPPHLLAQVQKSRLKVELCEGCGQMNETFSKQFKHLEKIEMEVKSSLKLIHRKFQAAMETNKTVKSQDLNSDADDFNGKIKMEIANALRTETMEKCMRKLGRPSPFVRIHRMPKRQVMANQVRNKLNPLMGPNTKDFASLNSSNKLAKVKEEEVSVGDCDFLYDSQTYTSDVDLNNRDCEAMIMDDPTALRVKEEVGDVRMSTTGDRGIVGRTIYKPTLGRTGISPSDPHVVEGKNYTINTDTGKLKCNLCSMEFQKPTGLKYHFESIHLGIKYKCNLCEKEFSHRSAYNRHHKTAHLKDST